MSEIPSRFVAAPTRWRRGDVRPARADAFRPFDRSDAWDGERYCNLLLATESKPRTGGRAHGGVLP